MALRMYDLNTCTSRNLTSIPGIEKKLADGLVQYRRNKGRFMHIDDIWKVPGVNRSRYQLLKKHCRVQSMHVPVAAVKLPQNRIALSKSMMEFVCQGKNMGSAKDNSIVIGLAKEGGRHTSKRAKLRGMQMVNSSTPGVVSGESNPPPNRMLARSAPESRRSHCDDTVQNSKTARHKSANHKSHKCTASKCTGKSDECKVCKIIDRQVQERQAAKKLSHDTSKIETASSNKAKNLDSVPVQYADSCVKSPGPSVVVKTSNSGNNLNLSCQIDKNFFDWSKGMHFSLGQNLDNSLVDKPFKCQEQIIHTGPAKQIDEDGSSPVGHVGYKTPPSKEFERTKHSDSTTSSSTLSEENLVLFERQNTPKRSDKDRVIEDWVSNVNDARHQNRLLKGRERLSQYGPPPTSPLARQVQGSTRISPEPKSANRQKGKAVQPHPSTSTPVQGRTGGHPRAASRSPQYKKGSGGKNLLPQRNKVAPVLDQSINRKDNTPYVTEYRSTAAKKGNAKSVSLKSPKQTPNKGIKTVVEKKKVERAQPGPSGVHIPGPSGVHIPYESNDRQEESADIQKADQTSQKRSHSPDSHSSSSCALPKKTIREAISKAEDSGVPRYTKHTASSRGKISHWSHSLPKGMVDSIANSPEPHLGPKPTVSEPMKKATPHPHTHKHHREHGGKEKKHRVKSSPRGEEPGVCSVM